MPAAPVLRSSQKHFRRTVPATVAAGRWLRSLPPHPHAPTRDHILRELLFQWMDGLAHRMWLHVATLSVLSFNHPYLLPNSLLFRGGWDSLCFNIQPSHNFCLWQLEPKKDKDKQSMIPVQFVFNFSMMLCCMILKLCSKGAEDPNLASLAIHRNATAQAQVPNFHLAHLAELEASRDSRGEPNEGTP